MSSEDPLNRMTDKLDLEHLRETSHHPSWWGRAWDRLLTVFSNRTLITVILAVLILGSLIWFFFNAAG